jgi:hypothetical protein
MIQMSLLSMLLCGCRSGLPVGYQIDTESAEVRVCLDHCDRLRDRCFGALARVFNQCAQRYPGNTLDQQACFTERGDVRISEIAAEVPPPPRSGCEGIFDACFMGCGGRIERPAETDTVSTQSPVSRSSP